MLVPSPLSPCQATASHSAASVSPLLRSPPPSSSFRPGTTLNPQVTAASCCFFACSLSSSRRQTRHKKNHLRTKQLSRNAPSPEFPAPSSLQPLDPLLLDELVGRMSDEMSADHIQLEPLLDGEDRGLLTVDKEDKRESLVVPVVLHRTEECEAGHHRTAAATEVIAGPKLLVELSIYLGALLAAQTVSALFFIGIEGSDTKDEAMGDTGLRKKKTGLLRWWGSVGKQQEIHSGRQLGKNDSELASKVAEIRAMANEARVTEAKETVQGAERAVGITGGVKQEVIRRLKRLPNATFSIVMHRDSNLKSNVEDKSGKSNFRRKSEIGRQRSALNRKASKGFNGRGKKAPRGVTPDTEVSRIEETDKPAVAKDTATEGLQTSTVSRVSALGGSLTENGDTADRNGSFLGEHDVNESGSKKLLNHHRKWWLKLPYVLGIYLRRASGGKNYRGLYTLKLNSHSDGSFSAVTIVFEDRGEATNFCYLLESYFEELPDVRADIVPITTQELAGAMAEKSLNAVVIKKGQLRLYAGQLLSEAETQLQFIVDEDMQHDNDEEQLN